MLADDMGLGKTVQTLALLAHRHLEEETSLPSLLVVPTSLVGNWRREAARFVPDLKVLVLHGPDRRRRFAEIPDHHLVVTTYPLLNRDHELLFGHDYDIAVLDEAQAVKNPAAAVSKRIREIRARQRLVLTGTPLENNLQEIWALYDWLVPGLLGNRKRFTTEFRTPIEKHGDRARQRLLSARVKPFLMRRTKEEVARELPVKTVIDDLVPLEGAQAALYESIRTAMDKRVREAIAARGLAASRIAILDALLKLRQVCCDQGLVKLDAARKVTASAKRARLLALLEELVAEGRKVLVFSQFVAMLKLVERDIAARGWGYAMLHGRTKDRDAQVAAFQSGDLPLFLVSQKAGGTGLNLTAADTVIVYNPWWNPAVERQAMDRAHRIGQDKPVFVHRLIAENTVEAAIQRMQARKQALADALFEGTGEGSAGAHGRGHPCAVRAGVTGFRYGQMDAVQGCCREGRTGWSRRRSAAGTKPGWSSAKRPRPYGLDTAPNRRSTMWSARSCSTSRRRRRRMRSSRRRCRSSFPGCGTCSRPRRWRRIFRAPNACGARWQKPPRRTRICTLPATRRPPSVRGSSTW